MANNDESDGHDPFSEKENEEPSYNQHQHKENDELEEIIPNEGDTGLGLATRARKAWSIAHMINFLNGLTGHNVVVPETILKIEPFESACIIAFLRKKGLRLGTEGMDTIDIIIKHPERVTYAMEVVDYTQIDGKHRSVPETDDEEVSQAEDKGDWEADFEGSAHCESITSSHPTGQYPQEYETFIQNEHGQWFVRFEKPLRNGKHYVQIDALPIWRNDVDAYTPEDEKEVTTYIKPKYSPIPLYRESDRGKWVVDAKKSGQWKRKYEKPLSEKEKERANDIAQPRFIVRSFDRNTGQYVKQYSWGSNWAQFDKHVEAFSIDNKKSCELLNRWLRQVVERNDHGYKKRDTREPWKMHELKALKEHFNDLIRTGGIIQAYINPSFKEALDKVNAARKAKDSKAALRNENSVECMCDRDSYPGNVARMGINEWRIFGRTLYEFQEEHPEAVLAERYLKPENAIMTDNLMDKQPGGNVNKKSARKQREAAMLKLETHAKTRNDNSPKLIPFLMHGNEIWILDRFGGKFVAKLFPVREADEGTTQVGEKRNGDDELERSGKKRRKT